MKALFSRHSRILGDAAWVFAGQGLSALGTLVAVRVITEAVAPRVYGEVALAMGAVAFANGLAVRALMQAVLRFYPDAVRAGWGEAFRRATIVALRRPAGVALGTLAVFGLAWSARAPAAAPVAAVCPALFVVEALRSTSITFLNAARRQRTMAMFVIADAWLRPVVAVALVRIVGGHAALVLFGYAIGGALPLVALYFRVGSSTSEDREARGCGHPSGPFAREMWRYALPLLPVALISWVSGQADRYLISALTGLGQTGLYAAIYGIASRPFLMLGAAFDLALRPPYYARVIAGDRLGARRAFAAWLGAVLASNVLLGSLFFMFHSQIASLLLAPEYRSQSELMTWIAVGYGLLAVAQVMERVCYAHKDTRGVLLVQAAGAVLSILVAAPLIYSFGVAGAAWAVPVYFGLQLAITGWRAALRSKPAKVSDPAVATAPTSVMR